MDSEGELPLPPTWLVAAIADMGKKYPNDQLEVVLRMVAGGSEAAWRLKCLDCPGKFYKPGPGETLTDFEVHLKNNHHRERVNERFSNSENSDTQ
ncbi:hypothetical protein PM082_009009 [Marasmius tenuissimus]|nr:hypothetical protein PM082_009009 [Marasmius tenuissimus]